MAVPDSMRTSDAERDQVLDRLRDALVEGRLDTDEFDERATATLAARTHGQLRLVTADLPPGPSRPLVALATSPPTSKPAGSAPTRRPADWGIPWGWLTIFAACSLIWLTTDQHAGFFWPVSLLVWFVLSARGRSRARRHHQRFDSEQGSDGQRRGPDRLKR